MNTPKGEEKGVRLKSGHPNMGDLALSPGRDVHTSYPTAKWEFKDSRKNRLSVWLYETAWRVCLWFTAKDTNKLYGWLAMHVYHFGEWALLRCDLVQSSPTTMRQEE